LRILIKKRDKKILDCPPENSSKIASERFYALSVFGHVKAMHNFASLEYKKGNYPTAYAWFNKAASLGSKPSKRNVERMQEDKSLEEHQAVDVSEPLQSHFCVAVNEASHNMDNQNIKSAAFWFDQAIIARQKPGLDSFISILDAFNRVKAILKHETPTEKLHGIPEEFETLKKLILVLNYLYNSEEELDKYNIFISNRFSVSTQSFSDHLRLVKYYNYINFGWFLNSFGEGINHLYSSNMAQGYLERMVEKITSNKDDYYHSASIFAFNEISFPMRDKVFDAQEGPVNLFPILFKRLAEIGTPLQKLLYAENMAKRDVVSAPLLTEVEEEFEGEDNIDSTSEVDTELSPVDQIKINKILNYVFQNLEDNADFIGRESLPDLTNNSNLSIIYEDFATKELTSLYDIFQEGGENAHNAFWLGIKNLIGQKRLTISTLDHPPCLEGCSRNYYADNERNQWYERAVNQIIEECDPEALNFYRVLKLGGGYINLMPPFISQKFHITAPLEGRDQAPYKKRLKEHLQAQGIQMPYFIKAQIDTIQQATSLTEKQKKILLSCSSQKIGKLHSIGHMRSDETSYCIGGYVASADSLEIVNSNFILSGQLIVEEPVFIKTRKFSLSGILDVPKGAVIVAEEFEFNNAKISNPANCHFIQVCKVKLDDSLDIAEAD
jgi:hypothetical protein